MEALDALEPFPVELRTFAFLTERQRGVFRHDARTWLDFNKDPPGLFVDIKHGGD